MTRTQRTGAGLYAGTSGFSYPTWKPNGQHLDLPGANRPSLILTRA